MDSHLSPQNAQIQFIDVELSLVHIPLRLYSVALHPILRLLFASSDENGEPSKTTGFPDIPFFNISINPVEASVVLPKDLAQQLFGQLAASGDVTIATDDYTLIFVSISGGSPTQATQRIIDLTTPLALARIPIFFITTYFSDYILCPSRSRPAVIQALKAQGFELNEDDVNFQSFTHRPNTASSDGSGSQTLAPGTPPPATLSELQLRTIKSLQNHNVAPAVDGSIRLVQCAGREEQNQGHSFMLAVLRCLLETPKFFSLTVAEGEAPSLHLETRYLPLFNQPDRKLNGNSSHHESYYSRERELPSLLVASDIHTPIMLDLTTLPIESIGIVCGVAGLLYDGTKQDLPGPVDMVYLSTAKAGAVMVTEDDLDRVVEVLQTAGNAKAQPT